jgi:hypothetical protein
MYHPTPELPRAKTRQISFASLSHRLQDVFLRDFSIVRTQQLLPRNVRFASTTTFLTGPLRTAAYTAMAYLPRALLYRDVCVYIKGDGEETRGCQVLLTDKASLHPSLSQPR